MSKKNPEKTLLAGLVDAHWGHMKKVSESVKFTFVTFKVLSILAHETAKDKGFWDEDRSTLEAIALIHSELSEAVEAERDGNPPSEKIPDFSAIEEELADVCIRIFDLVGQKKLDLGGAIWAKMEHNLMRPYKHSRKC